MIKEITAWLHEAIPTPIEKNKNIQVGVHIEEFSEMLESLDLKDHAEIMHDLANSFKTGVRTLDKIDRKELLDSLADQVVTATGVAYMFDMKLNDACVEVNRSNWSKFDENGKPIFDANGKIAKGPNYSKPNLDGMY